MVNLCVDTSCVVLTNTANVCVYVIYVCTHIHTSLYTLTPSHTHTLTQSTVDPASPTAFSLYYNVCTALDLLTFLLGVLPRPTLLAGFKILNKGFITCMTCGNTKVHTIL